MHRSLIDHHLAKTDERTGLDIHYGQALNEGVPFLGDPPSLTPDERQKRLTEVAHSRAEIYDLTDKEQRKNYEAVLNKICNTKAVLLFREHIITETTKQVYIEYAEYFMQDVQQILSQLKPTQDNANEQPVKLDFGSKGKSLGLTFGKDFNEHGPAEGLP